MARFFYLDKLSKPFLCADLFEALACWIDASGKQ
jgi:hypothetical protein